MKGAKKNSLLLFNDIRPILEELSDAERGRLFLALVDYSAQGTLPDFSGALKMAFVMLRMTLDRNDEKWEQTVKARSEAGKRSAELRAQKNFPENVSCKDDSTKAEPAEPDNETQQEAAETDKVQQMAAKAAVPVPEPEPVPGPVPEPVPVSVPEPEPVRKASDFDCFWAAYPKKVGKQEAKKAFSKVRVPLDCLLSALARQREGPQWKREQGRYIPNPATWLNQGRWEDEEPVNQVLPSLDGVLCL